MWLKMDVSRPGLVTSNALSDSLKQTYMHGYLHSCMAQEGLTREKCEVMRFANLESLRVPFWLALISLVSVVILQTLNVYWLTRMIKTVRARFEDVARGEYKPDRKRQ